MKKIILSIFALATLISCSSDDVSIPEPTDVSNVEATPRVGGALVSWDIPDDENFTYIEVNYKKNGKKVIEQASKFTDTLLIEGLINAEEFSFNLQSVNEVPKAINRGEVKSTNSVRPVRREAEITYFEDELEEIEITPENLTETYTQESSEGPKENLIDGDPNTYWHSAWSGGVAPLPHWMVFHFEEEKELGAISYWFRQNNADESGRPSKWGVEISDDGENWEMVWESDSDLNVSNASAEQTLTFDKNYTSNYFRILILENGSGSYAHLGEISLYTMGMDIVDKEEEAEEEYYNF